MQAGNSQLMYIRCYSASFCRSQCTSYLRSGTYSLITVIRVSSDQLYTSLTLNDKPRVAGTRDKT